MPAQVFTQPVLKILVVAAVVLGFVLWISFGARTPKPDEANRITHRAGGYSIIKPAGWDETISMTGNSVYKDWIELRPPFVRGAKQPRIFVGRFRAKPDLAAIHARAPQIADEFQGRDAYVFAGERRGEQYWRAIVPHGGEWYELALWTPIKEYVPDGEWWPYLNSFHAPDVPPPATTEPAIPLPTTQLFLPPGGD